jgi:hypothetical protein
MKRLLSRTAPARRPGDTDATVMALSGLVLVLLLLLAFVSGLALWQWRQVSALRANAPAVASAGGVPFNGSGLGGDGLPSPEEEANRQAFHVSTLVAAPAASPWSVLPMLSLDPEAPPFDPDAPLPDAPPGAIPGGLP